MTIYVDRVPIWLGKSLFPSASNGLGYQTRPVTIQTPWLLFSRVDWCRWLAKGRPQWKKKRFLSGIGGWCRWWWWLLPEKNQLGRDPFIFCQQLQLSPFQLEEIGSNSWTDNQTNWCSHTDFFFTYDTPIIELTIDIAKQCHLICHPIKFWQGTTFTVLAMVLYDVEAYWPYLIFVTKATRILV